MMMHDIGDNDDIDNDDDIDDDDVDHEPKTTKYLVSIIIVYDVIRSNSRTSPCLIIIISSYHHAVCTSHPPYHSSVVLRGSRDSLATLVT
jgi:hypothetical protein